MTGLLNPKPSGKKKIIGHFFGMILVAHLYKAIGCFKRYEQFYFTLG